MKVFVNNCDIFKETNEMVSGIQSTYVPKLIELHQGDIIYIRKTDNIPFLKLGDTYDFQAGTKIALSFETVHPAQCCVIRLIKNPPFKKWYQFWIKQQVVGYEIQVL